MNVFPSISQPENSNMCGAYSLAAALSYLDCFSNLHSRCLNKLDLSNSNFSGELICLNPQQSLNEIAKLIYEVTGIIPEAAPATFRYTNDGLNSIVAMAYVANKFDLETLVIIKDRDTFEALSKLYPQELELATSYGLDLKIGVELLDIKDNEVLLPTIVQPDNSKHSIAHDFRNITFDPADGKTKRNSSVSEWNNWLGVALKLTKNIRAKG